MTKIMAHSLRSFAGFCMGEFEKFSPEGTLYPLLTLLLYYSTLQQTLSSWQNS